MIKVSMIILSALSDAQELNGVLGQTAELHTNINFAKWLVMEYPNTDIEVNGCDVYVTFKNKFGGLQK